MSTLHGHGRDNGGLGVSIRTGRYYYRYQCRLVGGADAVAAVVAAVVADAAVAAVADGA